MTPRTQVLLNGNDKIKICDYVCSFYLNLPLPELTPDQAGEDDRESGSTLSDSPVTAAPGAVLQSQSAEGLKLILDVSNRFSKTLELDLLLPRIGDCLFQLFGQTDRCLVVTHESPEKLVARMVKARRPQDESDLRFSHSIVRRCLESNEAFLSYDAQADSRLAHDSIDELALRSVMCAPLGTVEAGTFGAMVLETRDPSKKFNPADLKLLCGVAHQASIALDNARQYEHLLAREQVERDLELAGQMQRSILPDQLPQFPGFEFFAHYAAAHEVGGDYYDFIPLPHERVAVALGDVVGKGISAAMLMAKLSSDVRFCLQTEEEPSVALARLNELIYKHTNLTERFVTLLAAVLDPAQSCDASQCRPRLAAALSPGHGPGSRGDLARGSRSAPRCSERPALRGVPGRPGARRLFVAIHGRRLRRRQRTRACIPGRRRPARSAPASSRPPRALADSSSKRSTNTPPAAASTTTSPSSASAERPNSGCMGS